MAFIKARTAMIVLLPQVEVDATNLSSAVNAESAAYNSFSKETLKLRNKACTQTSNPTALGALRCGLEGSLEILEKPLLRV